MIALYPIRCNICGGPVKLVSNDRVYSPEYAREHPNKVYLCLRCGAYVGVHWHTHRAKGILADKHMRKARMFCHDLFDSFWHGKRHAQKTTIAVAVLRAWIDGGHAGLLVPMCSLIDNLYTMRALNKEEWARYESRIRSTPLLVLDDLGGENTDQSWVLAKVDSIITERYNKCLPIIITTNLSKDELMGTYSGRIVDRLRNTSKYLAFHGASQRVARA